MMMRLSIRSRITLGSILVAALLLSIALLVLRAQVSSVLTNADTTLAESDLTSFAKDITANPTETVDDPGTGVLVFVRSPHEVVEVNTLPHDVANEIQGRVSANEEFTMTDDEGRSFIVVGRVVSTTAGEWALWSARSTSSSQLALEGLSRALVVGGLILLVGFGIASWVLATIALRPVAAMRRRADELEGAVDGALPVGPANDELAALASTLNSFLGRVRATAEREKQMVSDAAHELRTPLAALKTQLELAHGDFGNAAALAIQVTAAEASVDRLASLASNLLELSRLESHESVRPSRAASLIDEFTGSIDRARMLGLASNADIEFEVHVDDEGARYLIDGQAFGRLVDNLFSNALAAIGEGGAVQATLRQGPSTLILEVRDDGHGMPDGFVPVAFDRFTRPDASRTTATGGSGLGLALVRALAEAAGGTATIRNTNPGLAVTVTLPKM
ncbi:MAG: HAMP domain-containing histidine kinase [Salinibacterium sp.]|nr:HAMP domain-containing histidine kinase [Salinibacterium sp.]